MFLYVLIIGTVIYTLYRWITAQRDYFEKRQIKHFKPENLTHNMFWMFLKRTNPGEFLRSIYFSYPHEKVIGFFNGAEPSYFVRDLDLIRQMTIKDFDHFEDRDALIVPESDLLLGNSLVLLSGKKWHDMRSTLSPAFTGAKMRIMFDLVVECADDMTKYFIEMSKQNKPIRWEMKEMYTRYSIDVIASCAFGLKVNSFRNPDNEFFKVGNNLFNFGSISKALRILFLVAFPKLMQILKIGLISSHVRNFFKSMILNTMEVREKEHIYRPDMINMLMQIRQGNFKDSEPKLNEDEIGFATVQESKIHHQKVDRQWTDDELIAQCALFFVAGSETLSTAMSFISYELAVNQDIQQKLYDEILAVNEDLNGEKLTFDIVSKMKYLDQVVCETLRLWPPAVASNRICTKDIEYEVDGKKMFIERGKCVRFGIYGLHLDPKYFPNPEKFDPERFNDENKHKIKSGSYMPFGMGPRNCIGSRFALMEMKALLFHLILNFNIQPYEKTDIPLQIGNSAALWSFKNGIHLEFSPRNSN